MNFRDIFQNSFFLSSYELEQIKEAKKERTKKEYFSNLFVVDDIQLQKLRYYEKKVLLTLHDFSMSDSKRILLIIKEFKFEMYEGQRYLTSHLVIESPDIATEIFDERVFGKSQIFHTIDDVISKLKSWEEAYKVVVQMQEFLKKMD